MFKQIMTQIYGCLANYSHGYSTFELMWETLEIFESEAIENLKREGGSYVYKQVLTCNYLQ